MTSRALKMYALARPFHYLERSVTVNTVIYGRCTGITEIATSEIAKILTQKVTLTLVRCARVPAIGLIGELSTFSRGF